jgi:hypothetical protein
LINSTLTGRAIAYTIRAKPTIETRNVPSKSPTA